MTACSRDVREHCRRYRPQSGTRDYTLTYRVTTVMRGKLMATSQHAGQLVARRTDEFVRRVADECERQVAELSARAAGPHGRVVLGR